MSDILNNDAVQTSEETVMEKTLGATVAPLKVKTFYPTIVPVGDVNSKSLDFAFNDLSYAFSHFQKHDDSKHATLTITSTNNLMFNGQLLGSSYTLPSIYKDQMGSTTAPYSGLSNFSRDIATAYFCVPANATYIRNIHSFVESNNFTSSIGFVSHSYTASTYKHSYAYIINFNEGILQASIFDIEHDQMVNKTPYLFGGDRLKWNSTEHKYVLNQFDVKNADSTLTDPIPVSTSSCDGLMSKTSYSYVFQETGKLRTDVDELKKVTQAPCAYYVNFDTDPLFYRSATTGVKTTTYTHGNFWDRLINVTNAINSGLQIIGYSNNPQSAANVSYSYINVSSSYFAILPNSPVGDNSYCIKTWYTYNSRVYNSYIYMSSNFYNHGGTVKLSYVLMAYVSPLNMQEITSSNEGTFTK